MDRPLLDLFHTGIQEFCFELGLEHSFAVLLRLIRHHIPATKICSTIVDRKLGKAIQAVAFSTTGNIMHHVAFHQDWVEVFRPFYRQMDEHGMVYIVDDAQAYPEFWQAVRHYDGEQRSMLGMPLYEDAERVYYFGVQSDQPHAFTMQHARIIVYLKQPLAALLREIFHNSQNLGLPMLNAATETESALSLLSRCRGLKSLMQEVAEVAPTNANVLIQGATGVGKELVAEAIHEGSRRKGRPLVKVNCGAIPETLLEAELFGYERGAFTGAVAAHAGYFEQAGGGTLYLDEVGELSPMAQVRLLRVLESREVQRIGSPRRIMLDFRLVAATNRDLAAMVKDGSFRADLWYRLNSYCLEVPSLDRRREDIPSLAAYFCARCAVELGMEYQPEIRSEVLNALMMREWPGNIRQLRHWVERALIHTMGRKSTVLLTPRKDAPEEFETGAEYFAPPAGRDVPPPTLEELDRQYIIWMLGRCSGRIHGKDGAAERLGLKGNTLRARMQKLGIPFPRQSG